jgi:hypothetical protein
MREPQRQIQRGMIYTRDEEKRGEIIIETPAAREDPPPVETQGESWGWTKGPPYPRGYLGPDGEYGRNYRDNDDEPST